MEDRTLLAGNMLSTATALTLPASNVVRVSDFIDTTTNVDLFKVVLAAGDRVTVDLNAQSIGSGLNSYTRVFFDPDGLGVGQVARQIAANDDFDGRDSRLTFQAAQSGAYFIGVSASGNQNYNPATGTGAASGTTHGLFELIVTRSAPAATRQPDLVGAAFEVTQGAAVVGDLLEITYRIENRGGEASGAFDVDFRLSDNNLIDGSDTFLAARSVGSLTAGASFTQTFTVALPAFANGPAFIGMRIDVDGAVVESSETNNDGLRRGSDWDTVSILGEAQETEPNNSLLTANDLDLNSTLSGHFTSGDVDYFKLQIEQTGKLTVRVESSPTPTRVSLLDEDGQVVVQSDGESLVDFSGALEQHLLSGNYYLKVEKVRPEVSAYQLTTQFQASSLPHSRIDAIELLGSGAKVADFNGDGILDIVKASYDTDDLSVLLGYGDGTFAPEFRFGSVDDRNLIMCGDYDGDDVADIAVINKRTATLSLFRGNGDGTFQSAVNTQLPGNDRFYRIDILEVAISGDLNNDGLLDIAIVKEGFSIIDPTAIVILLGLGTGDFSISEEQLDDDIVRGVTLIDYNRDGLLDIAYTSNDGIQVLTALGSGTFAAAQQLSETRDLRSIRAGDVSGDGIADLVAFSPGEISTFIVLAGRADGSFSEEVHFPLSDGPNFFTLGDCNSDGALDLIAVSQKFTFVLLSRKDGSFSTEILSSITHSPNPGALSIGDFNEDGRIDLLTTNAGAGGLRHRNFLAVLVGLGDGMFQDEPRFTVGAAPTSIASEDFNGDGIRDIAVANFNSNNISVLLGVGDGSFQTQVTYPVGIRASSVVAGDFNGDGRVDLANVNNHEEGTISILIGIGDGTFQDHVDIYVGNDPGDLVTADFDADRDLDFAVAYRDGIAVLLGRGDGTFADPILHNVSTGSVSGSLIDSVEVGQFDGDDILDLVVVSGSVIFLKGDGQGNFGNAIFSETGIAAEVVATGHFNADDILDVAVARITSMPGAGAVLLGAGDGTFLVADRYLFNGPLVTGDFTSDELDDLAFGLDIFLANQNGDGSLEQGQRLDFNDGGVFAGIAQDFNNDGIADLAFAGDEVAPVFLGLGDGTFAISTSMDNSIRSIPLVADLTEDGVSDVTILARDGTILFRQGLAGDAGQFAAPIFVNQGAFPTARDIAIVSISGRRTIAAIDTLTGTLSFYLPQGATGFSRTSGPSVPGVYPSRLAVGDMNGDGREDLAITAALSNQVFVFYQQADG